jgi:hypothetical protein
VDLVEDDELVLVLRQVELRLGELGAVALAPRAVGHQVDFEKPGAGIVPLGEGANGDLVLEPRARARGESAIPLALPSGVFAKTRLRHGRVLTRRLGNRDF